MPTTITKTVKTAGGDYTSLSAWEAGEATDLVAADEIRQAECYAMSDTTAVDLDGWTTDATRYIRVYTPASDRHDGKWNTSKYRLDVSGSNVAVLNIFEEFTRWEGLQVKVTSSTAATTNVGFRIAAAASGAHRIEQCLVWAAFTGGAAGYGIATLDADQTTRIGNCIVWDLSGNGTSIGIYTENAVAVYAYNNTVQNCDAGIQTQIADIVRAKNCLVQDCTDPFVGTFHSDSTNNCSDTGDAPGSNPVNTEATFVDEANDDFHLARGSAVDDAGVDLSGDAAFPITVDIDGATRSGSWDIGADETGVRYALARF